MPLAVAVTAAEAEVFTAVSTMLMAPGAGGGDESACKVPSGEEWLSSSLVWLNLPIVGSPAEGMEEPASGAVVGPAIAPAPIATPPSPPRRRLRARQRAYCSSRAAKRFRSTADSAAAARRSSSRSWAARRATYEVGDHTSCGAACPLSWLWLW